MSESNTTPPNSTPPRALELTSCSQIISVNFSNPETKVGDEFFDPDEGLFYVTKIDPNGVYATSESGHIRDAFFANANCPVTSEA